MENLPPISPERSDDSLVLNVEAGTNTFYPDELDETYKLEVQDIENLNGDEIGKEE